ncbi:hypothetical protein LTR09_011371 [Extremus antarcticus]|uniref:Uncharacterized protein n=1 Tax=Extremus antarcticus TaxID=702011 RepID=A0AAJ0G7V5_9PEZI|nr:hypothetical protein LTR09_011371 [Extremus antarcticus]
MENNIDLQAILCGPVDQVVGRLDALLGRLDTLQARNSQIFDRLQYKVVKRKNDKDQARYLNLLSLNGPDPDTLDLVKTQANQWFADPSSFWTRPNSVNTQFSGGRCYLSSQAQIVGHYLRAKCDGA